jgi:membrane protease YdiL (CAAX protease family)
MRPPDAMRLDISSAPGSAVPPAEPSRHVFPNLRQTFLLLILFLGFTLLAAFVLSPLQGALSRQAWFLLVVLAGEGMGVLVGLRLARWPLRQVLATLGFSTRTLGWLLVIGFGNLLLIGSLLYAITRLFGPTEQAYLVELFTVKNAGQFLILFVTIAVAAPLLEELLLRGILLRGLTLNRGAWAGVLWSAFFFAVIHLNPLQAAPAFVNGVVWALVLLRTGSLGTTLFLHSLNNGFVFLLVQLSLLAARTGRQVEPGVSSLAGGFLALGMALVGLWLVRTGLRQLPRAPLRLAAMWGVSTEIATSRVV